MNSLIIIFCLNLTVRIPNRIKERFKSALTDFGSGLTCLTAIIDGALAHLKPGGLLAVEHGFDQSPAVLAQMAQAGFEDIKPHRDLAGHWRVASGRKPI